MIRKYSPRIFQLSGSRGRGSKLRARSTMARVVSEHEGMLWMMMRRGRRWDRKVGYWHVRTISWRRCMLVSEWWNAMYMRRSFDSGVVPTIGFVVVIPFSANRSIVCETQPAAIEPISFSIKQHEDTIKCLQFVSTTHWKSTGHVVAAIDFLNLAIVFSCEVANAGVRWVLSAYFALTRFIWTRFRVLSKVPFVCYISLYLFHLTCALGVEFVAGKSSVPRYVMRKTGARLASLTNNNWSASYNHTGIRITKRRVQIESRTAAFVQLSPLAGGTLAPHKVWLSFESASK